MYECYLPSAIVSSSSLLPWYANTALHLPIALLGSVKSSNSSSSEMDHCESLEVQNILET